MKTAINGEHFSLRISPGKRCLFRRLFTLYPNRDIYSEAIVEGDSGNAVLILLPDGRLSPVFTYQSGGGGSSIMHYANEIDVAINALYDGDDDYSLDIYDFDQTT